MPVLLGVAVISWPLPTGTTARRATRRTTAKTECSNPPYGTHDWIADQAMELLPQDEKTWRQLQRTIYLIGTEAPDHRRIPLSCGVPHRGYDDRSQQLERELSAVDQREHVSQFELVVRIEKLARQKVKNWRTVMQKRTPQTRQLLSKILRDRIVFVPETINGQPGFRFRGDASLIKLLAGTVPELASVHTGGDGVPNGIFKGGRPAHRRAVAAGGVAVASPTRQGLM